MMENEQSFQNMKNGKKAHHIIIHIEANQMK